MAIISIPIKKGGRAHVRFDTYKWVKIASPSQNHVHLSFHYTQQANLHEIHPRPIHLPPPQRLDFIESSSSTPEESLPPLGQINIPSRLTLFVPWFDESNIADDESRGIDRLFFSGGRGGFDENFDRISNRSIDRELQGTTRRGCCDAKTN